VETMNAVTATLFGEPDHTASLLVVPTSAEAFERLQPEIRLVAAASILVAAIGRRRAGRSAVRTVPRLPQR
jgi:hypothetical protein